MRYAIAKPCGFVLMTASLTGLPRFELSFKSRNDTVFLFSGSLKEKSKRYLKNISQA
ncbi:MAG: hypothetical protein IJV35_06840 [Neisseriaceae bacterium]|nr:hypothetical protein [Neisseriaceae bacterium]